MDGISRGNRIPKEINKYFTGDAWLNMMVTYDEGFNCSVSHVTFEPGCRNFWHRHPGGQILIVTCGKGYYQEDGKPIRKIEEGDVVKIAPNLKHWHGATHDGWFAHISIETDTRAGGVEWLESSLKGGKEEEMHE